MNIQEKLRILNEFKKFGEAIIKQGDPNIQLNEKEAKETERKNRDRLTTVDNVGRIEFERLIKSPYKIVK